MRRDYPGRVVAAEMAEVRPQAGGILLERRFEAGSEVRAGQALCRIDDAPLKAAHEEAKARLEKAESREKAARRQMERCIRLARSNAVPIRERDDAIAAYNEVEAEIKAAREQLRRAAIDLDYAEITAPVAGIIGRSLVPEGSLVAPNQQPLAVINQLEPVYVDIPLPVSDMISLRKNPDLQGRGRTIDGLAEIRPEAGSWLTDGKGERQQCKPLFSETRADEATGTVILRLSCPNPGQGLLPACT